MICGAECLCPADFVTMEQRFRDAISKFLFNCERFPSHPPHDRVPTKSVRNFAFSKRNWFSCFVIQSICDVVNDILSEKTDAKQLLIYWVGLIELRLLKANSIELATKASRIS